MNIPTSLIITTYNRPDALNIVLHSVRNQTVLPHEIIIADDGSGKATADMIEHWSKDQRIGQLIKHVWQPDDGFKLSAIRNKAIAASNGEYIIMVDGDMMLHRRFIEDHIKVISQGYAVKGNRIRLNEETTRQICESTVSKNISPFSKGILKDRIKAFRVNLLSKMFYNFKPESYYAVGSNMAFWRKDAIAVNGFEELFNGWGHEDSDFLFRLSRIGIKKRDLRFAALQYHLYHPQNSSNGLNNLEALKKRNAEKIVKANKGINQYLA